jgi:hypothetical protein
VADLADQGLPIIRPKANKGECSVKPSQRG